jgi:hypothetical protein
VRIWLLGVRVNTSQLLTHGIVYAATGHDYTTLARRAVRTLRQVMPRAKVDLFTDQNIVDPVFDQINKLDRVSFRPKMEAMRRSRFEKTILLDADAYPILKVNELYEMLDHYEFLTSIAFTRPGWMYRDQTDIPRPFPYPQGGVLVFRKTDRVMELALRWEHDVLDGNQPIDQPALRALLFRMKINYMVLPREYNMNYLQALNHWPTVFGCPRILHVNALHTRPPGDPEQPYTLVEAIGEDHARVLQGLLDRANGKPAVVATPANDADRQA